MITIYAQYSFGGYKIYHLTENSVDEVTANNRCNIPESAIQLFSHYGTKLLQTTDLSGNHILFVNDIHCKDRDDMGRAKTCSLVMVGTTDFDSVSLRKLAVMIAFELGDFELFFSKLFSIEDSLKFNYSKFNDLIISADSETVLSQDRLRNEMSRRNNPIVVYTTIKPQAAIEPLYRNFNKLSLAKSFRLKWDDNSRSIQNSSIDRVGFRALLCRIITKLTAIWKN